MGKNFFFLLESTLWEKENKQHETGERQTQMIIRNNMLLLFSFKKENNGKFCFVF